jgi:hypothetical protein
MQAFMADTSLEVSRTTVIAAARMWKRLAAMKRPRFTYTTAIC